MSKSYYSLGLMSGTSMDGVDASIIKTDGKSKYKAILDKYFEYPKDIYQNLTKLRDKIKGPKDLKKHQKQIKSVEKEITIFHAKAVNETLKKTKVNVDFIGFHGQTIFHNAKEKISRQLGDGKLLSKLTKKKVVYDFRQNDLKNGGQGAPLTPIFHNLLVKKKYKAQLQFPWLFINLGGIANYTFISKHEVSREAVAKRYDKEFEEYLIISEDSGPGNCLIDQWIKENSNLLYDKDGKIASLGKINNEVKNKMSSNLLKKKSYDIKDFNLSFCKELSLEDGAATLVQFTADTLFNSINRYINGNWAIKVHIFISGGGRKNKFLIDKIKNKTSMKVKLIDDLGIEGDFVESQAFAYLAIRSYLKLPISFPDTTGCKKPCTGGIIIKNF
jgi:anhydro-N-acetylmuramic acid kinase